MEYVPVHTDPDQPSDQGQESWMVYLNHISLTVQFY